MLDTKAKLKPRKGMRGHLEDQEKGALRDLAIMGPTCGALRNLGLRHSTPLAEQVGNN